MLSEGSTRADGWYRAGIIALAAWPDPVEITVGPEYHAEHRAIWERLGMPSRPAPEFIAAMLGRVVPDSVPEDVRLELERCLGTSDLDILPSDAEGEWLVVDRGGTPGTVHAELTQIGDEIHVYKRCTLMRFDRCTAAAYQLLHVFLHELGHHVDAMSRPHPGVVVRGESYAEQWAHRCADRIWHETLAMLRR